jgi:hypothetical protein
LGGSRSSAPACSSTSGETRSGPWPSAGESSHGQREEKGLLGAAPLPAEALAAIPDSQSCLGVPARPPTCPFPCCAAVQLWRLLDEHGHLYHPVCRRDL